MYPSIAVVIPSYNSETTIESAILSVLNQTEPPEEVIVVDDGSIDGTASKLEQFSGRVRLIRQKNQGAAVARQTGTNAATTDYIAYLDADDWWPIIKIARCREIIKSEDVHFLLADLQRARPGDSQEAYLPRNSSFYPMSRKYFNKASASTTTKDLYKMSPEDGLSLLLYSFPVYPSTMLVKRSVIMAVGGWDTRFRRCQDFDIGLRIARRFPLYYLDDVQAILGLHEGNIDCYAYVVKQTEGDIKVLKAHLEAEPSTSPYHRQVAQALGRKFCSLGYSHRRSGQNKLARQSYAKAIWWQGCRMHALVRWALVSLLCLTRRGK